MRSFLLMGQSNMAGRGNFGEVPAIENSLCFMLRNGRWQQMGEPINPDRWWSIYNGVGLSASFADECAKHFGEEIGLIPCADGGSAIKEWQPGEALYDHAVFQAKLAKRSSKIAGILWHQGENDSYEEQDAELYHERFMNMFTTLKKDLDLPDDIPVLIGEIGDFVEFHDNGNCKYFRRINEILKQLSTELPGGAFVSAKGLCGQADNVHFDSKSYREFGKRYFAEYLKVKRL